MTDKEKIAELEAKLAATEKERDKVDSPGWKEADKQSKLRIEAQCRTMEVEKERDQARQEAKEERKKREWNAKCFDEEKVAKEEALEWGRKMRVALGSIPPGPCCNRRRHRNRCRISQALALTPPQAYTEWMGKVGRLREALVLASQRILNDCICSSSLKPECQAHEKIAPVIDSTQPAADWLNEERAKAENLGMAKGLREAKTCADFDPREIRDWLEAKALRKEESKG